MGGPRRRDPGPGPSHPPPEMICPATMPGRGGIRAELIRRFQTPSPRPDCPFPRGGGPGSSGRIPPAASAACFCAGPTGRPADSRGLPGDLSTASPRGRVRPGPGQSGLRGLAGREITIPGPAPCSQGQLLAWPAARSTREGPIRPGQKSGKSIPNSLSTIRTTARPRLPALPEMSLKERFPRVSNSENPAVYFFLPRLPGFPLHSCLGDFPYWPSHS